MHVRTNGKALGQARRRAPWAASVAEWDTGPGVAQDGPLAIDLPATRAQLEAHLAAWPALIAAGVAEGRALGASVVFADAPPVAFEIARALGVPSVGMANFAWSWAYAHYAGDDPFFSEAAARLRVAEGKAGAFIALPGGGGLEAFGSPAAELVLRRPATCSRAEARRLLPGSRDGRPVVLLSFGGFGGVLDLSAAAGRSPEFRFVCFAPPAGAPPENLDVLPHDHDLEHQDLVLGADLVLGKPGYGTVSECLNGPTPMAYVVPSGSFREHAELVGMIERWLPCAPLSSEELLAGEWAVALRGALAAEPAEAAPPNQIERAVDIVRARL